jgi:hypothetical protein
MLEWTVRWGVPLALVGSYFALANGQTTDPSRMAGHAIEAIRDGLLGLIPKFF